MSLVDSRKQRLFTLCALYFAQGVPWGFMLLTLPSYLSRHFQDVIGVAEVGQLKAIILVPWSFKLIWTPLMDNLTIRSMGRRRPWIIGAELMMAATLFGFLGMNNPSEHLQYIIWMYFIHNCFASLQDVCTDALAVDVLPPDEQGRANGLMWGSKLVGKGVGGAGLSVVINWGGVEACIAIQVGILLAIMAVPLLILERPGEKRMPWSKGAANISKKESNDRVHPIQWLITYVRAFLVPTTAMYILFTLIKLIGVGINEVITNTLFTQHLDWTDVEFTRVTGLYATFAIIPAAIAGGWFADRYGRRKILIVGFGGYAVLAVAFALSPGIWGNKFAGGLVLISFETLNAIASVGFLSMAMRISWSVAAATVFTTYMTLSNVSHVIGNWLAGPVQSYMMFGGDPANSTDMIQSYANTFIFVGVTTAVPLLCLLIVRPEEIDAAEERELRRAKEAASPEDASELES